MNIFGFFGSATATMGIPSRLKTGDGRTMKTLGIHHGIQWKTIKDFWRSTKGPTWEFVLRMGNREKPTFGKNFLSEERNAKDHIPNQHGIYQAYIYIYTVYNIYCIYVGICPAEKGFFFGSKYWDPFLFHITNLGSSHWVPGYPKKGLCFVVLKMNENDKSIPLCGSLGCRVLSGLFTNNAEKLHGITIGSQLRNDQVAGTGAGHLPCRRGALGAPVPASDGGNICEQTCPWPGGGMGTESLRFVKLLALENPVWICLVGKKMLWWANHLWLLAIFNGSVPETTVQNRICKNYSWFEFKPCQSHGSPSWADDICHLWQTHIWHLSDTS